jgi:hypothetical protein
MIVGDAMLRSKTGQQKQLCHRCFSNKKQDPFGGAPCTGDDTFDLPKKQCGGGIRTTITFPTYDSPSGIVITGTDMVVDAGTERTSTVPTTNSTWHIRRQALSNQLVS